MQGTFTQQAGQWVAGLDGDSLSHARCERLQAMLLYNLVVALVGHMPQDPMQQALRQLYSTPGPVPLIGSGETLSLDDATASHVVLAIAAGFTDTHPACMGHIGSVMVPPLLALAQQTQASRADVVGSLCAGFELPPRLGLGAANASTQRGFRGTTVFGVFGAAAACARILRLDAERCAHALGIAASFASGLTQCFEEGTAESQAQTIQAARAGLHAAQLAAAGMKAAPHALEGRQGFYRAYAGQVPERLDWDGSPLDELVIKPFPGCAVNQLPVLLLQRLMTQHQIEPQRVASMVLSLNPDDAAYPGITSHGPFAGRMGAIMSAPFMLTVALDQSVLRLSDFSDRFSEDPVHARSRFVEVRTDASLAPFECELRIRQHGGETCRIRSTARQDLVLGLEAMRKLCPQLLASAQSPTVRAMGDRMVQAVQGFFDGDLPLSHLVQALRFEG